MENKTLQLQNYIQSQYYHMEQFNIMVHITYIHGEDIEYNKVILKEYHFYISDDRYYDLDYVQRNFELFHNHLNTNNI